MVGDGPLKEIKLASNGQRTNTEVVVARCDLKQSSQEVKLRWEKRGMQPGERVQSIPGAAEFDGIGLGELQEAFLVDR